MPDILVPLDEIETLGTGLAAIIAELSGASARQEDVEAAIGTPAGDGRLGDRCHGFESSWDDRRAKLIQQLQGVHDRVVGTVDAVQRADAEMAAALEPTRTAAGPGARAAS